MTINLWDQKGGAWIQNRSLESKQKWELIHRNSQGKLIILHQVSLSNDNEFLYKGLKIEMGHSHKDDYGQVLWYILITYEMTWKILWTDMK